MIRVLTIIGLFGTFAAVVFHAVTSRPKRGFARAASATGTSGAGRVRSMYAGGDEADSPSAPTSTSLPHPPTGVRLWWERAVYLAYFGLLLGILMGALTGLLGIILYGPATLAGWRLWLHFAAAPLFIGTLVVIVFAWGERNRFDVPAGPRSPSTATRVLFWVLTTAGFAALLTIMLSMAPVFSSEAQRTLYGIHRYAAIVLTISAIGHAYLLLVPAWRARRSPRAADPASPVAAPTTEPA